MAELSQIRNFCIIAHIDHGKSTLADRLLELTGTVERRQMKPQLLDTMELEQERGITIKLQPVRMLWYPKHTRIRSTKIEAPNKSQTQNTKDLNSFGFRSSDFDIADSKSYILNLIDTPGHVDFSYEVSRSLVACEGALLVVDATQGIQAQTLANFYLAQQAGLEIIPVVNKIDLPSAQTDQVSRAVAQLVGLKADEVIEISAKTGQNVEQVLKAIVETVPSPQGNPDERTRGLIFDSVYDDYRGVILYVRVIDGGITAQNKILMMGAHASAEALEVGYFNPNLTATKQLNSGEIGYIGTNLKSIAQARVGDTVTLVDKPAQSPLAGYRMVSPFVYASFYPLSQDQQPLLKEALSKLSLNDASLSYQSENSPILGFGFRVGFLGLLHLEIIKARLEREYKLELIVTNPSTDYRVVKTKGQAEIIQAAHQLSELSHVAEIQEPWVKGEILTPKDYVGNVMEELTQARGIQSQIDYLDEQNVALKFEAPLANIVTDFYDRLKSLTKGYGSLSYRLAGYRAGDLAKLDILIGGELVDPLSQIVHRSEATTRGRAAVTKLKEVIPRQLFEVSLQAAIGGKIIARDDIKPLGKNVTGHLYGGDVSRKRKLWAKQAAGKKRMKRLGKVDIPPEAFMALLRKE